MCLLAIKSPTLARIIGIGGLTYKYVIIDSQQIRGESTLSLTFCFGHESRIPHREMGNSGHVLVKMKSNRDIIH